MGLQLVITFVSANDSRALIIGTTCLEGKAAKGDNLVEEDPVAPDVRHGGEEAVRQAFWGHPPHWQHPSTHNTTQN